jgi:hypothetical protein
LRQLRIEVAKEIRRVERAAEFIRQSRGWVAGDRLAGIYTRSAQCLRRILAGEEATE